MTLTNDLLQHVGSLLTDSPYEGGQDLILRRAVSGSYYALFHELKADAAALLAPNVDEQTNHRIQRWFEHAEMKKICGRFLNVSLEQPLLGLIGKTASPELRTICRIFIELQEARHSADYDLSYALTHNKASDYRKASMIAIITWRRIKHSAEANIFILSLLLWKNWEDKERR